MNYLRKQAAKYVLYVGLPLFLMHFSSEAFEKIGVIQSSIDNIQARSH